MKLSRNISIGLIVVSVLASLALLWSLAAIPAAQAAAPVQDAAGGLVSSCNEASLLAALAGGGTVTFATTGHCVITVSATILMTAPTTIDGNGRDVTLSGGDARRIISATAGVVLVTLQNITLTRGFASGVDQNGGAMYVGGDLVLSNTAIISNTAGRQGGGVYVVGTLMLNNSRVLNNLAANSGGGVRVERRATLNGGLFQNNASARSGGGLFAGSASVATWAALTNTRFVSNTAHDRGGGMYANGPAALNGTQFLSNTSSDGGGIYASYILTLTSGVFQGNEVSRSGGGVYNTSAAVITGVQFISNAARSAGGGGAIYNTFAKVTLLNSTLIRNIAPNGFGGSINNDNGSTLTVQNSTFSGNRAILGGAISTIAVLTLTNSTLARNPADAGALYIGISGTARLYNSIIANDPAAGGDCINVGTIAINVRNLTRDGTCNPALSGDPLLGTLGNYGGSTPTLPLLPGSPAIDAGDAGACLARDQRGVARPQGSACDLGAFESRGFTLSGTGGDKQSASIDTTFANPLALTVSSSFAEPVNGGRVKFAAPTSGASTNPTIYTATIAGGAASQNVTANSVVGSYVVTATAQGAAPSVTYALTNTDATISGLAAFSDSPTQHNDATHLMATIATGSHVTYTWDLGDGNLAAGANVTHTYASLGTYTATVTATNSLGNEVATTVVQIVDVPITGLTVSNDSPTQVGNTTHFNATIATGASVVYNWNFGDGSPAVVGAGPQLAHAYPAVGAYTATITARNNTYTRTATSHVTVVEIPVTGLVAHNDSPTRVNMTTHFSATITTGSNVTYNWNFGDGTPVALGAGQQPTHVYTLASTYIATVTATNIAYTQVATTTVTVVPYRIMLPLVMKQQ